MKIHVVIAVIGLFGAGCVDQSGIEHDAPTRSFVLDEHLLMEISREAIAARLPDVPYDDLEVRDIRYEWLAGEEDELYWVRYRVRSSKRRVEEGGETLYAIDYVSVNIQPNGQIPRAGVSMQTDTYRAEDENLSSRVSFEFSPVFGEPFTPVPLNSRLPYPDRDHLERIALQAIRDYQPNIDADNLVLRSVSFGVMYRPEQEVQYALYSLTFSTNQPASIVKEGRGMPDNMKAAVIVGIDRDGEVIPDGVQIYFESELEGR